MAAAKKMHDSVFAPAPSTTRGVPTVMSVDTAGKLLVYGSGRTVVLRDLSDPLKAELWTSHAKDVTVAKVSPSGCYVASGDVSGVVKIWAIDNPDRPIKLEAQVLSGAVKDLQWSPDSQRLVAVGEGRESFGRVFMFDTGSSVGDISGHSKKILSCDFKQTRPFQVATGGEDFQMSVFNGPPFKFARSNKLHSNFVNCVRYSPDGAKLCQVGSDMKGFVVDSTSGDTLGELKGHKGTIYACAWSSDGGRIATASADKTVIIWDAGTFAPLGTYTFAEKPTPEDMQVGLVWVPNTDKVISLSLRGDLFHLDASTSGKITSVLKGHNKAVTALAVSPNGDTVVSASYDAQVTRFSLTSGEGQGAKGKGHTNGVVDISIAGDSIVSVALDDTLRVTSLASMEVKGDALALGGQPSALALSKDGAVAVVVTNKALLVLKAAGGSFTLASSTPVSYAASSVSLSPNGAEVAVGGDDKGVHLYALAGDKVTAGEVLAGHNAGVTRVAYSPCGAMIASGDASKEILIWDAKTRAVQVKGFAHHQAKITSLAWSPNSKRIVSGSLDTHVMVWDIQAAASARVVLDRAHVGGVACCRFLSDTSLVTTGADFSIKRWTV
mmetsp:Transcript_45263/g.107941  ORF Transcript_45263/g.107941 Transcript_45263/m.107941 type:complete len:609 (+) Transcript_45263:50-1876(+)|eukprot:CAMPEP_0180135696 /NCGR_PEP_ID=MMETSP0986-20121125/11001_1 /TAXON_ID=697907 /ORGANISM="non described non described, Strain CCMP2293" /LENGTH=608 /DNA_ID=CAMNT_0022076477 /DNA_START=44 /DNA_END=1870 /DNA_ORIENTATION=+